MNTIHNNGRSILFIQNTGIWGAIHNNGCSILIMQNTRVRGTIYVVRQ